MSETDNDIQSKKGKTETDRSLRMKRISERNQSIICSAVGIIMTLLIVYLYTHGKSPTRINAILVAIISPWWPAVILYHICGMYYVSLCVGLASVFIGWYCASRVITTIIFDREKVRSKAFFIPLIIAIVLFVGQLGFFIVVEFLLD